MIALLNFFISLLIPYALVAMFCLLSMVDNFTITYKNVVQSTTFNVIIFIYALISFVLCAFVDNDPKEDFTFIKKIKNDNNTTS